MANKTKKYETYPHRWGNGKVHLYLYNPLNKLWYVACSPHGVFHNPHGRVVDSSTPITCMKCDPSLRGKRDV